MNNEQTSNLQQTAVDTTTYILTTMVTNVPVDTDDIRALLGPWVVSWCCFFTNNAKCLFE